MRVNRSKKFKNINFKINFKFNRKIGLIIISIIIIGAALTFGGYYLSDSSFFKIDRNNIISNVPLSQSLKELILEKSLFKLDIGLVSSQLIREHPEYKKANVLKKFPSFLVIDVVKRKSFAQIKGHRFYPIDKEGVILSNGERQSLANLILIENNDIRGSFSIGDHIYDKGLTYAFEIVDVIESDNFKNYFETRNINCTNLQAAYLTIFPVETNIGNKISDKRIKVIIGEGDLLRKINLLKEVLTKKLQDKLKLVKYIDLRYKKVYVGFKR